MKILHTADWHIGQHLHSRKRYHEFEQFFKWLVAKIDAEAFDVLLVAGDVFDTTTPSNYAQELYNNFLAEISKTACRHVVITGGNHDSPSLLNAQRNVFKLLQIHVVGNAEDCPKDEVLLLHDSNGKPELIVCAVPYLRDRDIRKSEPGETLEEKGKKLIEGVRLHYAEVCDEAVRLQKSLHQWVPIIAMGHLFTAGGKTTDGDGVRDLYVGSLGHIHAEIFPACIDYLALGHLHAPQMVGGKDFMRYSGSPLPLNFSEACQDKEIVSVEFAGKQITVEGVKIPCFQALKRIRGDWEYIFNEIAKAKEAGSKAFLELIYTGAEFIDSTLSSKLEVCIEGSSMEILKINNERKRDRILAEGEITASLDDLQPIDVFKSLLEAEMIPAIVSDDLITRFREIESQVAEEDKNFS
ncbi:MAG: exonuclease SbcCD subunit D C-terminal domain-containing protein [Candidatus Protochlamydia sp.]|nr:exonuclease SbcCD subunit D C-terminal domain-containing protein [Candidatus Protochlamydia sp.]